MREEMAGHNMNASTVQLKGIYLMLAQALVRKLLSNGPSSFVETAASFKSCESNMLIKDRMTFASQLKALMSVRAIAAMDLCNIIWVLRLNCKSGGNCAAKSSRSFS